MATPIYYLRVCNGVETLDRLEKRASIVSAARIDLPVQGGHSQTTALAQHRDRLGPGVGRGVVLLHGLEDGEAVVPAKSVNLAVELHDAGSRPGMDGSRCQKSALSLLKFLALRLSTVNAQRFARREKVSSGI
jgi:hypothetical protein